MRRGIELPEFADFGALPAADGGGGCGVGFGMGELIFEGPATDLGAVGFEVAEAQAFAGGEAVVGGRGGAEPFAQAGEDVGGPDGSMIAAGSAGRPEVLLVVGAGGEVIRVELVAAAAGELELAAGLAGGELTGAELGEEATAQRSGETMSELIFFMSEEGNKPSGGEASENGWIYRFGTDSGRRAGPAARSRRRACRVSDFGRRSGCVPAEPYPPPKRGERSTSAPIDNVGGRKVRF